jgi:hypothetical protein
MPRHLLPSLMPHRSQAVSYRELVATCLFQMQITGQDVDTTTFVWIQIPENACALKDRHASTPFTVGCGRNRQVAL